VIKKLIPFVDFKNCLTTATCINRPLMPSSVLDSNHQLHITQFTKKIIGLATILVVSRTHQFYECAVRTLRRKSEWFGSWHIFQLATSPHKSRWKCICVRSIYVISKNRQYELKGKALYTCAQCTKIISLVFSFESGKCFSLSDKTLALNGQSLPLRPVFPAPKFQQIIWNLGRVFTKVLF